MKVKPGKHSVLFTGTKAELDQWIAQLKELNEGLARVGEPQYMLGEYIGWLTYEQRREVIGVA